MYFFTTFFADLNVEVYKTHLTQAELRTRIAETQESCRTVRHDDKDYDCWIVYNEAGDRYDAWEEWSDGKLYCSDSMARGVGERIKWKRLAYLKRAARAMHPGKRKQKLYNY